MNAKTPPEAPILAQSRALLQQLRDAGLTWVQVVNATGLSQTGLQNILNGKNKRVTSSTVEALHAAVRMLQQGHIGPQRTATQDEGDMVERYNRDAADAGLPQWDELRERDREEIRARWQEATAAHRRLAIEMENEVLRWAEQFVREKVQTR